MDWLWIAISFFLGAFVGILITALACAARNVAMKENICKDKKENEKEK